MARKKDRRTKAQKQQAKAAWARKRAQRLQQLSHIKKRVRGYSPLGAEVTETHMLQQLQHLLVNDERPVAQMAEEMGLSPGTVQRLRFGDTRNPMSRTLLRVLGAKGIALLAAPNRRRGAEQSNG